MGFDAAQKERNLIAESEAWDTTRSVPAEDGDIPIIDVADYFSSGSDEDLAVVGAQLREAGEKVGFFLLTGHGVDSDLIYGLFTEVKRFHELPTATKELLAMDRPGAIVGSGYLGPHNRKLPTRSNSNANEAIVLKSGNGLTLADNEWLDVDAIPGFRVAIEQYAQTVEALALRLLRIYAAALDLEPDYFADAFLEPLWRLRLTHYLPADMTANDDEYGIAPHVDTTFLTMLVSDSPGLTVYSTERDEWVEAPVVEGAFIVNTGELLKQWSNDRFVSVRHFVKPREGHRYSVPFFFNASADFPMECLPTCTSDDNPPKYPTISYLQSQGIVQGE